MKSLILLKPISINSETSEPLKDETFDFYEDFYEEVEAQTVQDIFFQKSLRDLVKMFGGDE